MVEEFVKDSYYSSITLTATTATEKHALILEDINKSLELRRG